MVRGTMAGFFVTWSVWRVMAVSQVRHHHQRQQHARVMHVRPMPASQPYNLALRQPKKHSRCCETQPSADDLVPVPRFNLPPVLCTTVHVHELLVLFFCTRTTHQPQRTYTRPQDSCWSRRWSRWLWSKTFGRSAGPG